MLSTADEILQLSAQRVAALARLRVMRSDIRTRIVELYQEGAAKIRMPAVAVDPLEAVLINTAGGLTGGDRIGWEIEAGPGARASITTQACEKVYRTHSGGAVVSMTLTAREGARIAWLPQETIVYDRSAFARSLEVDLADGAGTLIVEATVFGRLAMGERVGGPVPGSLARQAKRPAHPRRGFCHRSGTGGDARTARGDRRRGRHGNGSVGLPGRRPAAARRARDHRRRRRRERVVRWQDLASFLRGSSPGMATCCGSAWFR